ncbi:MAG TPA: hypothetical protein VHB20_07075 [Verrucomicrobiae bacterium]|jgi:hypothetical protein|nr:hypothetical protein [Verrucomicrobiae bacterium]
MALRRIAIALLVTLAAAAQELPLPPRPSLAPGGREVAQQVQDVPIAEREAELTRQILSGNVPSFLRRLCPVAVTNVDGGHTHWAVFFVAPDYLSVGSDDDFFFTPLRPATAQLIAERLDACLPTPKMVDAIYHAAAVKLPPLPIPPTPAMTTVPVFLAHSDLLRAQRTAPLGLLTAGDKKDVVVTARLTNAPGKVAIYGWHNTNGVAIQPLYLGHTAEWADYSHGIRLVQQNVIVDGTNSSVRHILADPKLCALLSDEGPVEEPRYPAFGERISSFTLAPDVRVQINAPAPENFASNKPVWLIFYALPNGSSIAQTAGRILAPGEDWHFDIQHIAAQTRFLRALVTNQIIVTVYLEAAGKSWPAWRKTHGDAGIPALFDSVKSKFPTNKIEITLASHSGGGSLLFGYLNAVARIPDDVERIAFLDSDYGYDPALGHRDKLIAWLKASDRHALCVLAYNDAIARLNGKAFVSAEGGTWGRSQAMLRDLTADFTFSSRTNAAGLEFHTAAAGRIEFLLHENPERKILHTLQVERNGFIHALLSGSALENAGYEYYGERAYANWVR